MIRLDDLLTGKEASPGHDTMSGSDAAGPQAYVWSQATGEGDGLSEFRRNGRKQEATARS
jgi:hypothetical protein